VNERAAELLRTPVSKCLGAHCFELVAGKDAEGRPFCGPSCAIFQAASEGREIPPVPLLLESPDHHDWWLRVLSLPIRAPDGTFPWLVHCAVDWSMPPPVENYLSRVASRTHAVDATERRTRWESLTKREREILAFLCDDESLHGIAARLHLSYVTVRNHVQHIQGKLGVHSILEAVACHLLATSRGEE
jgi:DNA-binding CsgD family transcriptional regulator